MSLQPWTALTSRRARRGPQPLVTYLDTRGSIGIERTELSATSVENAVAKIANALREEFDLGPGSSVGLHLPWHWQRSLWWGGCAAIGAQVVPYGHPGQVDLVACAPSEVDALAAAVDSGSAVSAREVLVVSLHPLGLPIVEPLPSGFLDATTIVRAQPDAFWPAEDPSLTALQVPVPDGALPGQRTLVAYRAAGRPIGDHRSASSEPWTWPLALPLAMDGSVVMVAIDSAKIDSAKIDSTASISATSNGADAEPVGPDGRSSLQALAAQEQADRIVLLEP